MAAQGTFDLVVSRRDPNALSESLDQTGALYFTVTTTSTVGYGDIAPKTDAARLVVTIQMVFNVALIGAVLRLLFNTAKRRVGSA